MKLTLSKGYSMRGADMGRMNVLPDNTSTPIKLRLERLRWVDGDYDQGGAYWGGGPTRQLDGGYFFTHIYCAWTPDGVRVYTRARSRAAAKEDVREKLLNATFFR